MFRSLSTRLVALYVLVAIALVVLTGGAVTAFALSTFVIGSNEAQSYVAREAPELVKSYASRHRTLADAAPDIVRRLSRPGLRVAVVQTGASGRRMLAIDDPMVDEPGGHVIVFNGPMHHPMPGGPDGPPPNFGYGHGGGPPGGPPPPMFERGEPLPLGLSWLFHVHPRRVPVDGGVIVVFMDPRPLERTISSFWIAMVPIGILSILAAWLLGRYITGQALRPLVETTAALRQFAEGDFTPRAIVSSERNEIGELVTAYNGAAQQVTRAFEERRFAELQMRQFVADAGHELRTPLTVIMGFVDVLRRRGASGDIATANRIFDTMTLESRRMRALIDRLIVLARLEAPEQNATEEVMLGDLLKRVVGALDALDPEHRLVLNIASDAIVIGDAGELHEALVNILENALKYAPRSVVEIDVSSDTSHAYVSVTDHGEGLSAEECGRVFDRFYRGHQRGESEGFGLGLAIAKRAVERAGGEVRVQSAPGEGTRFMIDLPRLAPRLRSIRSA